MATRIREWTVGLQLVEEDGTTTARAVLDTGTATLTGRGAAHCNPQDVDIPQIGEELAAGRAMRDLSGRLMRAADHDLEAVGAGPAPRPVQTPLFGWPPESC
ncbi:DUF1876 domain-containing protein [Streptomyces clavuligerus]|uniref:DUF1876 domain-containing protein n=1 Tax=Streptomyces clavuligerus TaxID=1901 RepID=B5H3P7_STRCL|nr:DUF1876 domain-containing protein [Streptomyces clavuligerus]ANW18504.1 hypothetical protein BB341_09795 [Streptomyces clavuligerus]AXU13061.1 DUF1876 domain-containing protein [Streptomyces clavuligerus]EDY53193.1 hypothetical protein SSCG_06180 [Streptomyces clavuligerus]EFG08854.1 DUF1876 domain-containing protein [Streptomyces clavuligerus]MBY6302997.1 DUF1876 domain-containing protein [Streptomyces clavuligerus]